MNRDEVNTEGGSVYGSILGLDYTRNMSSNGGAMEGIDLCCKGWP